MAVHLTKIYTRTGDAGTTRLADFSETGKNDPRLCAYADVDEANAAIGVAVTMGGLDAGLTELLLAIQNDLFDVGADLATPVVPDPATPPLRITQPAIDALEAACDRYNADLEPLRSFILPGGTPGAALLHVARTVTRRAERSTWAAVGAYGDSTNTLTAIYLNRLSDLLFILGRVANADVGDVLWQPGRHQQQASGEPAA
ncbi:MAG TPA: cob(I)yrinic acid a,c-diamide adenosyltransferase [Actinopolymorphaceae bacterium]